ncbi:hypothetical protein ACHAXA_011901 [Cyclostephanos tholiformis]|uniref:Sterol regulatory element-binding protein cleavage-activating protein n=1 Tax=Cyclostephanos tholiformis TaxID=382380 RepID=A0ABD3SCK3_9STRA
MVVAALIEHLFPAERGLARDEYVARVAAAIEDDDGIWRYQTMTDDDPTRRGEEAPPPAANACSGTLVDLAPTSSSSSRCPTPLMAAPATRKRQKRCRASKFLASVASDFNVVTDWVFYFHCVNHNRVHHAMYLEDPDTYVTPYMISPALMSTILLVCVLGTALWLVLVTNGRVAAPLLRTLGYDKVSMGYLLFISVMIDDIPQIVLTFVVEDYFETAGSFNNFALINVVASLYDTLMRLAEAFDERMDMVETGIYCKQTLWAHRGKVTCVVPIPITDEVRDDYSMRTKTSLGLLPALNEVATVNPNSRSPMHLEMPSLLSQRKTIFEEVRDIISDTKLPRLRFLSASEDHTVRLWDTDAKEMRYIRKRGVTIFQGHSASVTCMAIVELSKENRQHVFSLNGGNDGIQPKIYPDKSGDDEGTIFLTGSSDGSARLWSSRTGRCHRSYVTFVPKDSTESIKITSIAHLDTASVSSTSPATVDVGHNRENFVCGYESGKIRMWNMLYGICLAIFDQHVNKVHSICALRTSDRFASAGQDGTIKVWRIPSLHKIDMVDSSPSFVEEISSVSENLTNLMAPSLIRISDKTIVVHAGPVLTVAYISPNVVLTGSADCTARVWNLEKEVCLRVFTGHVDAVTTVAVVDHFTFLTGSRDNTIKFWDGLSASCIRTYTGHTAPVTSVTTASPGTFISSSEDLTVKLWVFTAISPPVNTDTII